MKILVTGGSSMVGKHLQKILPEAEYLSSQDCNLLNLEQTQETFKKIQPTHVIHLAAKVGGIMDNIKNPVNFFEENIYINTNVLKSCFRNKVDKFTGILSTCIYPDKVKEEDYPMKEELLHKGPPTQTNFAYGYAKRCLAVQIKAYNEQFNTKYSYLTPCNLYSEYDHFEGDKAHFISSVINKINQAKKNREDYIQLFGSGKPLRQFMYAEDLAKAIYKTLDEPDSFGYNIANRENYSIKEMAEIAIDACGAKNLKIKWDSSKPDGQFRKDACSKKFFSEYPDFEFTSLYEGIKKVNCEKYNNEKLETK